MAQRAFRTLVAPLALGAALLAGMAGAAEFAIGAPSNPVRKRQLWATDFMISLSSARGDRRAVYRNRR